MRACPNIARTKGLFAYILAVIVGPEFFALNVFIVYCISEFRIVYLSQTPDDVTASHRGCHNNSLISGLHCCCLALVYWLSKE